MLLSDFDIRTELFNRTIVIDEFREQCLGTNSYDVHLGKHMLVLRKYQWTPSWLSPALVDCKANQADRLDRLVIPDRDGIILEPGDLYLGVTEEYTETHGFVPFLEGKSSLGRLGVSVHITAGKGDDGFCGHWTMEITVMAPTIVYAGMPVAQLIYHTLRTPSNQDRKYHNKPSQKYGGKPGGKRELNPWPQTSRMHKNFTSGAVEEGVR